MLLAPLPDAARLWLFAADRALTDAEAEALLDRIRTFTTTWTSHARPVAAAAEVLEDRVLAVGATISEAEWNAGVSGCGIDKLQHAVDAAAEAGGLAWTPPLAVLYRDADGRWQSAPRGTFRHLAREGTATAATHVLDLTHTTVGALRAHGVVRPAGEAWHRRAFWPGGSAKPVG